MFFFFLFLHAFERPTRLLFMNSSRKVWLFPPFQHKFYCSWTHKFHFSATFSLKMGPTVLFTHLKIILLQCFSVSVSVFSFQLYLNGPLVHLKLSQNSKFTTQHSSLKFIAHITKLYLIKNLILKTSCLVHNSKPCFSFS